MVATLEDLESQVKNQNYTTDDNVDTATLEHMWDNYKNGDRLSLSQLNSDRDQEPTVFETEFSFYNYREYDTDGTNDLSRAEFEALIQNVFDTLIIDKDKEKQLLLGTGLFENDGIIDVNEIASEEMKTYLVNKLGLDILIPEEEQYLNNVIDFLKTLVDDTSLNVDELIEILQGTDGIIDEHSIQNAAKTRQYTVDLNKPELINDNFKQSTEDNCWFLSSLGALNNSEAGRSLIDQAVEKNQDGTYTVTFPAYPENSYTITQADIDNETSFVIEDGEKILTVLNIAANRLENDTDWRDYRGRYQKNKLRGGSSQDVAELFKIDVEIADTDDAYNENIKKYLEENPNNPNLVFGAAPSNDGSINAVTDITAYGHLFYVKSYDAETQTVTYINPWDTSKERTISFDEFVKYTDRAVKFKI